MTPPSGGGLLKKVTGTTKTEVGSWFNHQKQSDSIQGAVKARQKGQQQRPQPDERLQVELGRARRSIAQNRDALRSAIEQLPGVSSPELQNKGKQVDTTYLPLANIEVDGVVIKIECKSKEFMRHLQRHSRKSDLARVLKLFSHRPFFVLNETLPLASNSDILSHQTAISSVEFATGPESILGTRALLTSQRQGSRAKRRGGIAVVGGVIIVNDTLYGLSIGHYDLGPQPLYEERPSSAEPNASKLARIQSFISSKTDVEPEDSEYLMIGTVVGSLFSSDEHPTKFHDWALVELTLDLPHQNSLRRLASNGEVSADATDVIISDIFSEQNFSNSKEIQNTTSIGCYVVTKEAVIPGEVSAGCTSISMSLESSRNIFAEVLVVHLKEILPRSSSGSWVVIDAKLLGTVIAGADNPPRAFVVPIEDTFQSIKEHLHASRVCLPSRTESSIFKLQRLQQVSRWLRSDEGELLELELLLAQRQSELNPFHDNQVAPGTGWLGVSRQEAIGQSAKFLTDFRVLLAARNGPEGVSKNTVGSLLLLSHIFPVDARFRASVREWLSCQDPEDEIDETMVDELLLIECGENLLGLIIVFRMVLHLTIDDQDRHEIWFMNLFISLVQSMEFPPSLIPSARQFLVFVHLILHNLRDPSLASFNLNIECDDGSYALASIRDKFISSSGVRITAPNSLQRDVPGNGLLSDRPTLNDLNNLNRGPLKPALMSRLLLQLSDVAHGKGTTVLVCGGDQEMLVVGWIAAFIFGLSTERREFQDGRWKRISAYPETPSSSRGPDVYVFSGQGIGISEILNRTSLPQSRC
ncbi:hypothetical protein F4859DRAFT_350049 [Xylaria cf. heliscus]|nr:hypothetical protein F4859DRAFT_350049 [Xylaria cf. heliscus]